jgi:hypothetical protein
VRKELKVLEKIVERGIFVRKREGGRGSPRISRHVCSVYVSPVLSMKIAYNCGDWVVALFYYYYYA